MATKSIEVEYAEFETELYHKLTEIDEWNEFSKKNRKYFAVNCSRLSACPFFRWS